MDLAILLVVLLILVLIWRGPETLPKLGRALGLGAKAVRDEAKSVMDGEQTGKS